MKMSLIEMSRKATREAEVRELEVRGPTQAHEEIQLWTEVRPTLLQ